MSAVIDTTHVTVREQQLRLAQSEATKALRRVMHESAMSARAKLRFGPGQTCEHIARMLDKALMQAEVAGLDVTQLVLSSGRVMAAEHIIRVRRKAHGVADWISSPTSDVTIELQPRALFDAQAQTAEACVSTELAPVSIEAPVAVHESAPEQAVREALRVVLDPDLGVNIVDMGFVRRVQLSDDNFATITMTLTTPTCPLAKVMTDQMKTALSAQNTAFAVNWEWQPSWRPADITPAGRAQLEAIGFTNL